jgi:hypothetical protein
LSKEADIFPRQTLIKELRALSDDFSDALSLTRERVRV